MTRDLKNQNATPNRRPTPPRVALTLAEVLIAMGIMTLGLLGVASIFPVGGFYMQSGDIADRAGGIAHAALDDAIVRGHLDPENWVTVDIDALGGGPHTLNRGGASAGEFFWTTRSRRALAVDYSRRLTLGIGTFVGGQPEPVTTNSFYGAAYVIDPLGMAAALETEDTINIWQKVTAGGVNSQPVRRFPASAALKYEAPQWSAWTAVGADAFWPVRRLTTTIDPEAISRAGTMTHRLQSPAAEALFTTENDLALSLPTDGDAPSQARWQTWRDNNNTYVASRQPRGEYSWMISVSPGSSEARDALSTRPDAFPMEVSAVVFHKRVLGRGYEGALEAERLVKAKVVSTGASGGELLLERFYESGAPSGRNDLNVGAGEPATTPFEELREGQFIMLTGPHPQSTADNPLFVLRWYRVLGIEDEGVPTLPDAGMPADDRRLDRETRVLVSLRGPDWPWQPARTGSQIDLMDESLLSNDLRVAIVPGVVAVHTKTMRLESGSRWAVD